jgi:DNA-binding MarR family transcriptional regulator
MNNESRYVSLVCVEEATAPEWAFLTNHAQVLICIAHDAGIRLRDIGERLGITESGSPNAVASTARRRW